MPDAAVYAKLRALCAEGCVHQRLDSRGLLIREGGLTPTLLINRAAEARAHKKLAPCCSAKVTGSGFGLRLSDL